MTVAPTDIHHHHRPRHRAWTVAGLILIGVAAGAIGAALLLRDDGTSTGGSLEGSGTPATDTRSVGAFDAVELAGSNNVVVHVGGDPKVVVHADDNLLDRVTTEVVAGALVVDDTGSFATQSPMSVDVTVPSLQAITLSGSGNVVAADVHAQRFDVTLSGSGNIGAAGDVTALHVLVSGSGDIELTRLVARDAHAVVQSSGHIAVNATDSLDATVAGTGAITYVGSPEHVTKNVTGTGAIVGG